MTSAKCIFTLPEAGLCQFGPESGPLSRDSSAHLAVVIVGCFCFIFLYYFLKNVSLLDGLES